MDQSLPIGSRGDGIESLKRRLKWLSVMPSLPLVALQARRARKLIPRLPDAGGPVSGTVHCSSSLGPELRLLVLGESTVSGVGASTHELGLTGRIASTLAESAQRTVCWRALGKNGATVARVRQLLLPQLGPEPMDLAVIAVGANDAFRLTRVARWREDLEQIVTTLLELGCKRVFISALPPVGSFPALPQLTRLVLGLRMALLAAELPQLARDNPGVVYCPIDFTADCASDGIHPSEQGYAAWGAQLTAQIVPHCLR